MIHESFTAELIGNLQIFEGRSVVSGILFPVKPVDNSDSSRQFQTCDHTESEG